MHGPFFVDFHKAKAKAAARSQVAVSSRPQPPPCEQHHKQRDWRGLYLYPHGPLATLKSALLDFPSLFSQGFAEYNFTVHVSIPLMLDASLIELSPYRTWLLTATKAP